MQEISNTRFPRLAHLDDAHRDHPPVIESLGKSENVHGNVNVLQRRLKAAIPYARESSEWNDAQESVSSAVPARVLQLGGILSVPVSPTM